MKPRLHLLVCCNRRPDGGRPACGGRGATDVVAALQSELAARPQRWSEVRITETGCLGPCFDGPTLVAYPAGTWYGGVTAGHAGALLDHYLDGAPARELKRLELGPTDGDDDSDTPKGGEAPGDPRDDSDSP